MRFVESSHETYSLSYHIVWVTKYRRRILNPGVVDYLRKLFSKLIRSIPGVEIEEIGFDKDYIHFVMEIPPKYSISDVMAQMKSQSASALRARY
ncbi:MAG: IS200/IS605 family transposase [Alphaproteobacteria bacterium]|nr:IS200/IS605 family transposase [Alphaproteobacteria bacterium]